MCKIKDKNLNVLHNGLKAFCYREKYVSWKPNLTNLPSYLFDEKNNQRNLKILLRVHQYLYYLAWKTYQNIETYC